MEQRRKTIIRVTECIVEKQREFFEKGVAYLKPMILRDESGKALIPSMVALTSRGKLVLFCGAQALGMADLGSPEWNEKGFDYDNSQGIAIGKILGFLKPKFGSIYESSTVEDFGVLSCYVAQ